jgi:hypothetical protein
MQYFFAQQLRQYRLQFIRAFSNFYVNFGTDSAPDLRRVPCRYGDSTRIAESVVRGNSENKILSTPFISCTVSSLAMASNRRQDPQLVEKVQVNEREYDEETGSYTSDVMNRYTVERYMPVPYELTMQVDIWTNNTNIKEQLLEQILMLYNPSIDVQTSNNPLDWTWLTYIEMQENINWSSRSIPIGTDNPIDVMTLSFKVPIFINPPAKVKRQSIIQEIITNIIEGSKNPDDWEWSEYEFLSRVITTPGNASVSLQYNGNGVYEIRLLTEAGSPIDPEKLPTVTSTVKNPRLAVGTSFKFNGIKIDVNTSNLAAFVDQTHPILKDTPYSILLHGKNTLRFINNEAGDNVFDEVGGSVLPDLGLEATTYPGGNLAWWRLFEAYGTLKSYSDLRNNASQIRIKKNTDLDSTEDELLGWIEPHPTDQNRIQWIIDQGTIPPMTLSNINAIIDPRQKGPNNGLPPPQVGQRYLLLEPPTENSAAWGDLIADENDIIEFQSTGWTVVFDASVAINTNQFVTNVFSGKIYEWSDGAWRLYVEELYTPGYWRIAL